MTYTAVDRLNVFYFVCCYVILASESKEACFFLFLEKISSGSEVCDIKWGGDGGDKPGVWRVAPLWDWKIEMLFSMMSTRKVASSPLTKTADKATDYAHDLPTEKPPVIKSAWVLLASCVHDVRFVLSAALWDSVDGDTIIQWDNRVFSANCCWILLS